MALDTAAGEVPATSADYIKHHLEFLTSGQGFYALHLDSIFIHLLLAALFLAVLFSVARKVTPGVPGKLQAAVELLVEIVDKNVKESFHGRSRYLAPLALTTFVLAFLMNAMDFLPVDLLPAMAHWAGLSHLRAVPTADLNTTAGMAIGVFFLIQYYGVKHKGIGTFFAEFFTAPFHSNNTFANILLAPFNLLLRLIEEAVRPLSLCLRLFGNMYAGELIFVLIATMTLGASLTHVSTYVWSSVQWLASIPWYVLHLLIVALQAFIFMILTVIYISMAAEQH